MEPDVADLDPVARTKEQRAWNWYDWANSAYYTTTLSVLFAPYMITAALPATVIMYGANSTLSVVV